MYAQMLLNWPDVALFFRSDAAICWSASSPAGAAVAGGESDAESRNACAHQPGMRRPELARETPRSSYCRTLPCLGWPGETCDANPPAIAVLGRISQRPATSGPDSGVR